MPAPHQQGVRGRRAPIGKGIFQEILDGDRMVDAEVELVVELFYRHDQGGQPLRGPVIGQGLGGGVKDLRGDEDIIRRGSGEVQRGVRGDGFRAQLGARAGEEVLGALGGCGHKGGRVPAPAGYDRRVQHLRGGQRDRSGRAR